MESGRRRTTRTLIPLVQLLFAAALTFLFVEDAAAKTHVSRHLAVHVEQGWVRGRYQHTVYGFPYVSFSGIPYAEPPVGSLRYKAPVPKASWTGELDATVEGSPCPQVNDSGAYLGKEDCLYLNVYVPHALRRTFGSRNDLLKVMVWIHGGGFVQGEGGRTQFGPDFLIERGIILVTFNYRLGVLGFLSMESEAAPGNYGLKDQTLALQWVRRNIRSFGGDPDDVTLFGESAGAASVNYHLLSNSSWGLFSRAIAASASALSPWAFTRSPRQRARSLAAALGLPTNASDRQALHLLSRVPPWLLLTHTRAALSQRDNASLLTFVFVPSVEPIHDGAFLTEEPSLLLLKGQFLHVPYITGVNSKEGNFFVSAASGGSLSTNESLANFNKNFVSIIGPDIRDNVEFNQNTIAEMARGLYYGNSPITRKKDLNTSNLLSDLFFEESVDTVVRVMAAVSHEPVRYYRFSFKGPNSAVPDEPGVAHGEDLKYLFHTTLSKQNLDRDSDEGKTRDRMVGMWTNFAKYGDPTPITTTQLTTTWKPYTESDQYHLDIGTDLKLDSSLDEERMDFWHQVLPPLRHI
ncbi:cholinesterase 1-like isoform X1 [Schistocerca piceifrons]|uniref:cholinesterase 1-like isoform X1 n=1 Tax=Schistocerca piceifrons TaxID=274613 RepID=UPI001F5F78D3|nr:cholinesterase 1-like isoform X1 [Schistocerca piceifrons]